MEWSGRAAAPPVRDAGKGWESKEHSHVQQIKSERATMGIDIGKNSFHVVGLNQRGAIMLRQKWSRGWYRCVKRPAQSPTFAGHGSYQGISCRQWRSCTTVEDGRVGM
jgi:hypothetical protein